MRVEDEGKEFLLRSKKREKTKHGSTHQDLPLGSVDYYTVQKLL